MDMLLYLHFCVHTLEQILFNEIVWVTDEDYFEDTKKSLFQSSTLLVLLKIQCETRDTTLLFFQYNKMPLECLLFIISSIRYLCAAIHIFNNL